MKNQNKKTDFNEIKIKPKVLLIGMGVILLATILIFIILAYGTKTVVGTNIRGFFSRVIPAPIAIIDYKHLLFASEIEENLSSVQKFYATQDFSQMGLRIDFSTPDGQKRLLIKKKELTQKMIEDEVIKIIANKHSIDISKIDVDKVVSQKLQEFGTTNEVKKNLLETYGWTLDDFKKKAVLPGMYKEALIKYFNENNSDSSKVREIAEKVQKELAGGKDFGQVVSLYSNGSSKEKGGQLGWVKKDQLLPELQDALFGKEKFQNGSIVESSIGFHIVEVQNQKKEAGEDVLQLRQVFLVKYSFADWLSDEMKKMSILITSRDFFWNKDSAMVEFNDKKMVEFEKQSREKAQGDASIVF